MSTVSDKQWLRSIGVVTGSADKARAHDLTNNFEIASSTDDLGTINDRRAAVDLDANDQDHQTAPDLDTDGPTPADRDDFDVDDLDADPADIQKPPMRTQSSPDSGDDDGGAPRRPRRFTPWVAGTFGGVVALATVLTTVGASLLGSPDPARPPQPVKTSVVAHPSAPAPTPSGIPESVDQPLPFTASADCPAGSTTAQSVADPDKPTPWICVRHTDGQPLSITLGPAGMERSYVITAVSIVPGDTVPAQATPTDPWLQHRVVTRLQWQFNDTANTVLTQNTGNVHGDATLPVPRINASKITVIIQQTSRPPATTATTTPTAQAGPFGDILDSPAPASTPDPTPTGGNPQQPDPSDTTFAVTSIKIIGHRAL